MQGHPPFPELTLLAAHEWDDYELLDSGDGLKLERYGPYSFVRPEHQALWRPSLPPARWQAADAEFQPSGEESGGHWQFKRTCPQSWQVSYKTLRFEVQPTPGRHLGVFPEQASHWDWMSQLIRDAGRPVKVLNLFGYTGLATLAASDAGALVTHVDASKKSVQWARSNYLLSGLQDKPVRWLVDDAEKFVRREVRRGAQYDGILLDPPKFGRGPSGQVWEFFTSLPDLLEQCRLLLSEHPIFIILTAYAIRASALSIHYALQEMLAKWPGQLTSGELALVETSSGRLLPTAIFSRWQAV